VHSDDKVREVFRLLREGLSQAEIARQTGVSRAQVRDWQRSGIEAVLSSPMRRASAKELHATDECAAMLDVPIAPYAYLLGQYLGDGCISIQARGHPRLRIATCDDYPVVRAECIAAIRAVAPSSGVCVIQGVGSSEVAASSIHWPCLFPQHGPGPKHLREIRLAPWQRRFALEIRPDLFVRGLIHSDRCRVMNRVVARGKRYEYSRYFFDNESDDIRYLFIDACTRLGVYARHNRSSVSVARRESVAILDRIVGPKR
jgi:transcriptional regulator with XRE-family HTH domain